MKFQLPTSFSKPRSDGQSMFGPLRPSGKTPSLKNIWQESLRWLQGREQREQWLLIGALGVALFIGLYTVAETTFSLFQEQSDRLTEVERKLASMPPLLQEYNRLEGKRLVVQERFSKAGTQSAMYAHLEGIAKRKAKIQIDPQITRSGAPEDIGTDFIRQTFNMNFRQITSGELADFLREISADEERPAIISKLNISSIGNALRAELTLSLIARKG